MNEVPFYHSHLDNAEEFIYPSKCNSNADNTGYLNGDLTSETMYYGPRFRSSIEGREMRV